MEGNARHNLLRAAFLRKQPLNQKSNHLILANLCSKKIFNSVDSCLVLEVVATAD